MRRFPVLLSLLATLIAPCEALQEGRAGQIEFYEARVRPLFVERCSKCHGRDKQKAGLRLDTPSGLRAGSETGAVVVPGDVDTSKLLRAVSYEDHELQMPPKGRLSDAQIAVLVEWVASGASMPEGETASEAAEQLVETGGLTEHWCFKALQEFPLPAVEDQDWPQSSADHFILAELERVGLEPAPPTSRALWLRRVTMDLRGMPPTVEEVLAFQSDREAGAHGRVVDRLLASPRFGETWARHWLDLMRYAETKGHEFDYPIPNAWQYRDYLIRAFNEDVPYDELVVEHIAGDLLPEPRRHPELGFNESVLGTGSWFLGDEVHSPVDLRKDETDRIANQIDVISKAFLGLTVACARCHDHKFDPISQRDYYALSGYATSSHYRQVRFESAGTNTQVARELAELRDERSAEVARAVGRALREDLKGFANYLLGTWIVLADLTIAPCSVEEQEGEVFDLLFEDFEGDTWQGWTAEGEAFGDRPLELDQLGDHQRDVGARGRGLVNSHNAFVEGELRHTDEHVGTLTSDPFVIKRGYIHMLVGGGSRANLTAVQLLIDDEVVVEVLGPNNNRMQHRSMDVRELQGKTARLMIVDRWREGWGNIGVDHIVMSNLDGAQALDVRYRPEVLRERAVRIQRASKGLQLETGRLEVLVEEVERAGEAGPDHPLAVWARLVHAEGAPAKGTGFTQALGAILNELSVQDPRPFVRPTDVRTILDYTRAGDAGRVWLQNGVMFGPRPRRRAEVVSQATSERSLVRVQVLGAAQADPFWKDLRLAPGVERDSGTRGYVTAGRTLVSPTFELEGGRLHYLVRGAAKVYAGVDSHHLLQGPLHGRLVTSTPGGTEWRWMTHDLTRYAGHRVHLEFTPPEEGNGEFELAMVVEGEHRGAEFGFPSLQLAELEAQPPRTLDALADRTQSYLQGTADALASGASALEECDEATLGDLARTLEWAQRTLWGQAPPADLMAELSDYRQAEEQLASRAVWQSRTAPAMMDGSGFDERFLARGSSSAQLEPVPRRFLAVVCGDDARVTEPGSGRQALAAEITRAENPTFSRVAVNRIWHHLMGRGIVTSVDDMGVMGEDPTHPRLLDHLALRFSGELAWSVKSMIRELVLSSTYRQDSAGRAVADVVDPINSLWHKMPVKRVTAEALRDSMLVVSGQVKNKMYGPSVPVYLTPFMEGRGRPGKSGALDGEGRRSVYLAVRRNFLVPRFLVFDFPVPSTTIGRRSNSNVPAQSLTLLNDPFVKLQSEHWAERLAASGFAASDEQLDHLYLEAYGRPATEAERLSCREFLAEQTALLGEEHVQRALADLCHVLLNVKEFRYLR